ncbi:MAG TPA: hypothetical protein PKO06_20930, partial [Candidatus Ozemobacteraceae bacterium]|nr:hypothetical protein [Candidatus Ozemobacteraceae bacterium]
MDLGQLDKMTRDFADARATLEGRVTELNDAIDTIKRKYLPLIKHAVTTALDRKSKLEGEIEKNPQLFVKPRMLILHGIKIGLQKTRDGLAWEDDDQVVKLIKKHFSDQVETLVKVKETPVKQALAQLSVADLRK